MAESPPDLDSLSLEDLKKLVLEVLAENARLKAEVAALREENSRLKGLPKKPRLKPSGMEKKTDRAEVKRRRRQKRRGAKNMHTKVTERRVIEISVPAGSRFKGYQDIVVQELRVSRSVILYRRQRWQLPDGRMVVAPLPSGIEGHFGPELRRFVLAQYHRGQSTVERLLMLLQELGIEISKRLLVRVLTAGKEPFVAEAEGMLQAGLETASWVTVEDTGARHATSNQYCTQIGDDRFAWFATRPSKSRLNFLELLQAGERAYMLNTAALDYMRERRLSQALTAALKQAGEQSFYEEATWQSFAAECGVHATNGAANDPLRIATEGALWGALSDRGLVQDTAFVSDGCVAAGAALGSSPSAATAAAGSIWSARSTLSTPSPKTSGSSRKPFAHASGSSTLSSRPGGRSRAHDEDASWLPASTRSSPARPASSPSITCWPASTLTVPPSCACSTTRRFRSTPTARRTTSAAKSPAEKSAAARTALTDEMSATPCSAS